ncbi:uncharacterized protein [Watersipora subatra]|uniref:uncharacterized protein n=1 Tax=Watersipora subatra TaxID=2589382 RepID=UPI00355C9D8E
MRFYQSIVVVFFLAISLHRSHAQNSRFRNALLALLQRIRAPPATITTTTPLPVRIDERTLLNINATLPPLSINNLMAMREEFARLFTNNSAKVNRYVQMGFHVCVGGCDGCLNTNDTSNAGLVTHYAELRRMHKRWENVTSLADYAVISFYEAIRTAVEVETNMCNVLTRCRINLPFTSGRFSCINPDNPPTPEFPKGDDITTPQRMVEEPFGLTEAETVALMGCHSLGSAHSDISGFNGDWDLTPKVLDHGYFEALALTDWKQEFVSTAGSHQWSGATRNGKPLMMLHADIVLQHRITLRGSRKEASCRTTDRCSKARGTSRVVERFATDNKEFIQTLGRAIVKMSNTASFDPTNRMRFE